MKLLRVAVLPLAFFATASVASEYDAAMKDYLDGSIRAWANDPVLVQAITAANAERAGLDQAKIDEMDTAWRAEVGQADTPTMTPVMTNAAADFLRGQVDASGGKITEVFITDNVGLNVAASSPTSDMWQGDEEKFTDVFPKGAEGVLFGEIELDESTQTYQGQISISITDPATSEVIGTMTIGVNAEALM
ncbi:hypothetical protein [Fuscovulum ytuae]|uniref:Uncharacterized protein n=1 Tax=Fuscovulum ytuae TaxID=3042299 RepID=A0ABY8Q7E0_9RHOB|nr:hypothetical protein [Fuscovulum sp. YMD61]WGV16225.1 hypothetical protein QF092_18590 [Fuscovulum sp. YMD61]